MNRKFIKFYQKTKDSIWREWIIFTDGPKTSLRGCYGNILLVQLSDGRKIKTNDLWHSNYFSILPKNSLSGEISIYTQGVDVDETYIY
jgi:hypothetical protein